jgi:hypothetical protein
MTTPFNNPSKERPSENGVSSTGVTAGTASIKTGVAITNDSSGTAGSHRSRVKTEEEITAEKLYEERIEDEYAKREGGA